MSVTCPCCRAVNDAGPQCRRCKADLALVFAFEEQLKHEAIEAAIRGDYETALELYRAAEVATRPTNQSLPR